MIIVALALVGCGGSGSSISRGSSDPAPVPKAPVAVIAAATDTVSVYAIGASSDGNVLLARGNGLVSLTYLYGSKTLMTLQGPSPSDYDSYYLNGVSPSCRFAYGSAFSEASATNGGLVWNLSKNLLSTTAVPSGQYTEVVNDQGDTVQGLSGMTGSSTFLLHNGVKTDLGITNGNVQAINASDDILVETYPAYYGMSKEKKAPTPLATRAKSIFKARSTVKMKAMGGGGYGYTLSQYLIIGGVKTDLPDGSAAIGLTDDGLAYGSFGDETSSVAWTWNANGATKYAPLAGLSSATILCASDKFLAGSSGDGRDTTATIWKKSGKPINLGKAAIGYFLTDVISINTDGTLTAEGYNLSTRAAAILKIDAPK